MQAEFWGILHDGGIESISGDVPGTVSINVSIRYLRQYFPGDGIGFRIELGNCTRFEYQEYDAAPIKDFAAIVAMDPEILSLNSGHVSVVVNCVMGSLTMAYEEASVFLDSGAPVTFDELCAASKAYWDEWRARIKKKVI
ncbi:hypothetical protein [Sapientia aquatica]|uniref:Uncharacterized protein n=1 Tax=Sapientia aquatica TaxID=1549640 RepID=A0A4R5VWJ5_9BURK|nr:hypothetical protein [Sapientia aquatica]TDK63724.1 hypothetical protein E2I14_14215 [Sapientia aquatica]